MKKVTINCKNLNDERYEYLIQFLKDCKYDYKEENDRDRMLDSLAYYLVNDSEDLPEILDRLLAYDGDSNDLGEICPKLVLWQNVEGWSFNDLMGAIK
jgi:hypothetical protein